MKVAEALLETDENKTNLPHQLNEFRKLYEQTVKNGTTDDQIPTDEHHVKNHRSIKYT